MKTRKSNIKLFIGIVITLFLILAVRIVAQPDFLATLLSGGKEKIEISGVKVNDFTQKAQSDNYSITILKEKNYHIFYFKKENKFLISIVGYPFDMWREEGEKAFVDVLGISKRNACKLNVEISTPYFANPDKAGQQYPLSFCKK